MIEIGKVIPLIVAQETKSGFYLGDTEGDQVFMPGSIAPKNLKVGDQVNAFIYTDSQNTRLATASTPYAQVGEFACLEVKSVTEYGAFMDWGIEKDLLVPGNLQKEKMREGHSYLVYIAVEKEKERVYGTSKIQDYIEKTNIDLHPKEEISMLPYEETDLGIKVLINKKFLGMIYKNEIFTEIEFGKSMTGYVRKIREDGLIDAMLQPDGMKAIRENRELLLAALIANNGFLPLHDKSKPDEIVKALGISKLSFKKAVGTLYKERRITLETTGIRLLEDHKESKK